mmetsp:Transcript_66706/g.177838  ORF Transcript_66706/g.177838 Transcript_66706/m.177838 type:complete len:271 (+) Transcript_66706:3239-4051(+)
MQAVCLQDVRLGHVVPGEVGDGARLGLRGHAGAGEGGVPHVDLLCSHVPAFCLLVHRSVDLLNIDRRDLRRVRLQLPANHALPGALVVAEDNAVVVVQAQLGAGLAGVDDRHVNHGGGDDLPIDFVGVLVDDQEEVDEGLPRRPHRRLVTQGHAHFRCPARVVHDGRGERVLLLLQQLIHPPGDGEDHLLSPEQGDGDLELEERDDGHCGGHAHVRAIDGDGVGGVEGGRVLVQSHLHHSRGSVRPSNHPLGQRHRLGYGITNHVGWPSW